ncbi:MAG: hypothetical protein AMS18_16875 [Gemmatimonas sp. SG8_17]|nr:MAG: hypothetical protein AMS18_16875 [Gemmatimonas sp. SG8_17]
MCSVQSTTALVAILCVTASCAAGTQGSAERTRSSRAPITVEELASHQRLSNAYEAVQNLRPRWLRARGPASFSGAAPVIVYMDNVRAGGVDFLLGIPLDRVSEIRFFDAADATTRWGTGVAGGVIEVITATSRPML